MAIDALVEGSDSPSLRELAGLGRLDDARAARELFPRVVEELHGEVPTQEDAAWFLTGAAADDMIEGRKSVDDLYQTVWAMYKHTPLRNEEIIRDFMAAFAFLNRQTEPEEEQSAQWAVEQIAWVLRAESRGRRSGRSPRPALRLSDCPHGAEGPSTPTRERGHPPDLMTGGLA